jgi:predicted enzyme related to lactoylglutathione lyase
MNSTANALNWFEIPAVDHARAKRFYEKIFDITMDEMNMMGINMIFFPTDNKLGKVGGAIVQSAMHKPSQEGLVVYLNANEQGMENVLNRIPENGGQVLMPKTKINDEVGYMAFFLDTEGNKVGLHSMN